MRAVLPGQRLRDRRRRRRRAAAADQRLELRALQDVRHHGPVRRHHLGAARRRRRARSTTACDRRVQSESTIGVAAPWRRSWRKRTRDLRLIAGARQRRSCCASCARTLSAGSVVRRSEHLRRHRCVTGQPDSWRSGTAASCPAPSTSGAAASSSSPARTSTASGSRASSSGSATAPRAGRPRAAARGRCCSWCATSVTRAAAFTLDGPRGPARVAQPGAVWLAKATGQPVLPFHLEAARYWTLRSWDRTQIPKPFARVALAIGEPLRACRRRRHRPDDRPRRAESPSSACRTLERALPAGARPRGPSHDSHSAAIASPITSRRPAIPSGSSAPRRMQAASRSAWGGAGCALVEPRAATTTTWPACTTPATSRDPRHGRPRGAMLDPDTFTSPDPYEVARLAAGAVLDGVDHVLATSARTRRIRAGAAAGPSRRARSRDGILPVQQHRRRRRMGARRAASSAWRSSTTTCITATARSGRFYDDPSVLFVSSHQFPFYPGTGAADEVGTRRGRRLHGQPAAGGGRTDADFDRGVPRSRGAGARREFRPELMLVSAGFDAHEHDPLGGMRMTHGRLRPA